jgi:hypothetical protein
MEYLGLWDAEQYSMLKRRHASPLFIGRTKTAGGTCLKQSGGTWRRNIQP